MATVNIDRPYLSKTCIDECLKEMIEIRSKKTKDKTLNIVARNTVKNVDILLIAHFILFKKQVPNLEIVVNLTQNSKEDKEQKAVIFTVWQYAVLAYLAIGEAVFSLKYIGGLLNGNRLDGEWYTHSTSFLPFLYIDIDSYNTIFQNKVVFNNLSNQMGIEKNDERLFQTCRRWLVGHFRKPSELISLSSQLAFYSALRDAKILSFYLYEALDGNKLSLDAVKSLKLQASYLQHEDALNLFEAVKGIFVELKNSPPVYTLVYSSLLSSSLLPSQITKAKQDSFKKSLEKLMDFSKAIVLGIREMAKNIVEHSTRNRGVITWRVYGQDILAELKDSMEDDDGVFKAYLQEVEVSLRADESDPPFFFDINIIDDGEKGVSKTLLDQVKDDKDTKGYLKELAMGDLEFNQLLNPSFMLKLNHQAKRTISHLGLLIFSKLITSNMGLIRASTWQTDDRVSERESVLILPEPMENKYAGEIIPMNHMGTNYHVIIPFNEKSMVKTNRPPEMWLHAATSEEDLKGMEHLITFHVIDLPGGLIKDGNCIFRITPEIERLDKRGDEAGLWDQIKSAFPFSPDEWVSPDEENTWIACLNLCKVFIDGSQLYRLLGKWALDFSKRPLIVYNIRTETFLNLVHINGICTDESSKDFPYWSKEFITVFYHYINTKNGPFFYTDILWGDSYADYLIANRCLSDFGNFNATTVKNSRKIEELKLDKGSNDFSIPLDLMRFGIFQKKMNLLPFDLILDYSDQATIFEQNASVLLQKEIIKDNAE